MNVKLSLKASALPDDVLEKAFEELQRLADILNDDPNIPLSNGCLIATKYPDSQTFFIKTFAEY